MEIILKKKKIHGNYFLLYSWNHHFFFNSAKNHLLSMGNENLNNVNTIYN